MFGLGFPELLVILVVCLFIFGPGKLPQIGAALGKGIRDFQRALKQPPVSDIASSQTPAKDPEKPDKA